MTLLGSYKKKAYFDYVWRKMKKREEIKQKLICFCYLERWYEEKGLCEERVKRV
jgi:hypothetical protein